MLSTWQKSPASSNTHLNNKEKTNYGENIYKPIALSFIFSTLPAPSSSSLLAPSVGLQTCNVSIFLSSYWMSSPPRGTDEPKINTERIILTVVNTNSELDCAYWPISGIKICKRN